MGRCAMTFKPGDIVTIGKNGFVHWEFLCVSGYKKAVLKSGMTGRLRVENVNNLKPWKP